MLKLFTHLITQKRATIAQICPPLPETARGLPAITTQPCSGSECNACAQLCPTDAIAINDEKNESGSAKVALDLGACIGCGLCFQNCPTGTIAETLSTRNATKRREDLILTNDKALNGDKALNSDKASKNDNAAPKESQSTVPTAPTPNPFDRSLYVRVVSTGCSACDLELGASGNPIFDIERFGVHIVASPRYADALLVTGPVGKSMQPALLSCYKAMAEPRVVVAVGTCAISGGVHRGGYAQANGVDSILPVDVYIPGCPPDPWQIIYGALLGMGREGLCQPEKEIVRMHNQTPGLTK